MLFRSSKHIEAAKPQDDTGNTFDVSDAYDAEPTCKIIDVTCDEAVEGEGDGNTSLDWQDTGDLTLDLRS